MCTPIFLQVWRCVQQWWWSIIFGMRFVGLNLLAYSTEESIRRLFARFWNIAYLLDVVVILSQHPIKLLFLLWKIMMMLIDKLYLVNLRSYLSSLDLFRYQNIRTFYGSISHWFKHQRILSNSSNSLILLFHFTTPSDKELFVKEWKTNINFFLRDMRVKFFLLFILLRMCVYYM